MERKNIKTHCPSGYVLAFDPSITAFGWVVMKGKEVVDCGCIKTAPTDKRNRIRKGDDRTRRVTEINTVLMQVIDKYDICYIVSELPHGSQSAIAATMLGIVTGMVQTIADIYELGLEWYSEADSKRNALGKQSAEKKEMINKMKTLYHVDWTGIKYKDEAIADALGVYDVASKNSAIIKFFR